MPVISNPGHVNGPSPISLFAFAAVAEIGGRDVRHDGREDADGCPNNGVAGDPLMTIQKRSSWVQWRAAQGTSTVDRPFAAVTSTKAR